jgi:tetratricopeptide (TPR) repeat protein
MKSLKPIFLIFLIALAALIPFTSSFKLARHINPREIPEESLLPEGLLAFYFSSIDLLTLKQYNEALEELNKTHFFYAPENLKFITSRFNELLADTANKLKLVELYIEKAERLIDMAKLEDAKANVDEASKQLSEAEKAILNLESSSIQLSNALKVKPKPLLDKIGELKALAEGYAKRIEELLKLIEELTPSLVNPLIKPELTIQASALEAWVGERLIVNGSLKAFGKGLARMVIRVYFEGIEAGRALTDENGTYSIEIQVPYVYKPFATMFSVFTPSKGEIYAACSSNALTLRLLYNEPKLFLLPFSSALPGRKLIIQGSLSLIEKPIKGWRVKLHAFGNSLSTFTDGSGRFRFDVFIPPDTPVGSWPAVIEVPPSGSIAPIFKPLTIKVERIQARVKVEAPSIALAGSKITFKGWIRFEGMENLTALERYEMEPWQEAMENLTVVAKVGEWMSIAQKVSEGFFSIEVYVPLSALIGDYAYSISVEPNEPWVSPTSMEGSIFILNPSTLMMPALAIFVAALTVRKVMFKEEKGKVESPKVIVKKVLRKPTEGLAALYWSAIQMISTRTGVKMEDSYTIREYLHAVADKLNEGLIFFERLSLAYEKLLYARWISLREEDEARSAYFKLQSLYEEKGLEAMIEKQIFCIYCGEKLPPKANYCDKCGKPVYKWEEE